MTKLTKNELLDALAQHGYALNRPAKQYAGEEVLLSLLNEHDGRLLEGFPVVYRHVLTSQNKVDFDLRAMEKKEKAVLYSLLLLSYALFKHFDENKQKLVATSNLLSKLSTRWKKDADQVYKQLSDSKSVQLGDAQISTDRLKQQYKNYALDAAKKNEGQPKLSLELELLLSQFFTSKQKELLLRHSRRQPMSKTEREYYSRVVRKRLKALANESLRQFVCSIVERS